MSQRASRPDQFRSMGWLLVSWLLVVAGCGPVAVDSSSGISPSHSSGGITQIAIPGSVRQAEPHGTAVSARGEWLAMADYQGRVELLDVAGGKWHVLPRPDGVGEGFGTVAFSNSGRFLATTSESRAITIWDLGSKKPVKSLPLAPKTSVIALIFLDDDRLLHATVATPPEGRDINFIPWKYGTARWDLASGERQAEQDFGRHPLTLITSPDGRYGVVSTLKTDPTLIDFQSGQRVAELGEGNKNAVFSADGKTLVVCERGGAISVRDVPSGRERKRVKFDPKFDPLQGELSLSADARLLAVGGYPEQRSASVISLGMGKILGTVESGADLSVCHAVKLSPDGLTLLTCTGSVSLEDSAIKPELKLWKLPASW